MHSESRVKELLSRRKDFLQLVVVAALLALGVNLLSTYLSSLGLITPLVGGIGLMLTAGALLWVLIMTLRDRYVSHEYDAAFLFDSEEKCLIPIPDYGFSEELSMTISAVFSENKGLEQLWLKEPLVDHRPPPSSADKTQPGASTPDSPQRVPVRLLRVPAEDTDPTTEPKPTRERRSAGLVREATEYLVLHRLSMHLQDHFGGDPDEHFVSRYSRRDIPDLLLQNRVLALLSSPYEDRAALAYMGENVKPGAQLVMAWGPGGEIYERFELFLPNRTVIRRTPSGELELDSPRLRIRVGVDYQGFTSNEPPRKYVEMVLGKNMWQVHGQEVKVRFSYAVKTLALLRTSGWEYHEWVDSFAADLEEWVSVSDYLARINWPSVAIQSHIFMAATHSRAKGPTA